MMTFLEATQRAAEIPESADAYGWLAGTWDLDVLNYFGDVREKNLKGEVHFAWVLEGRAVQDVWVIRPMTYGTTMRVWDANLQAWRVTWFNPVSGVRVDLVGRWQGKDVVQIGTSPNGTPIRWNFSEITPDSFRWTGETLNPDGTTWKLEGEFRAKRKEGHR